MDTQVAKKKEKGNPIKLVWLITLLSFSVGVFMIYLVWSTLTNIRTERENLFQLKDKFSSLQAGLESNLALQRSEISSLFEARTLNNIKHDFPLQDLLRDYRRTAAELTLTSSFEQLGKEIDALQSVKDKLTWWAGAYNRTVPRIPMARQEVEKILQQILEAVDRSEEEQRLECTEKINKIRSNARNHPGNIPVSVIDELAAVENFSIIRRHITDLLRFSDHIHTLEHPDDLDVLKDNEIRTLLNEIRNDLNITELAEPKDIAQIHSLLDEFATTFFGQGYTIDNSQQTVITGHDGIYTLILNHLKLLRERETLRAEVDRIFAMLDTLFGTVFTRTEAFTRQEELEVEKVLGQTWRTMLIIWFVTSVLYVMLAYEIIAAARQQIKDIEDSNIELETMANELKESQDRLHRLSSDLFSVQENERKRISFELHDELGQSMAALKLQVGSIARRLGEVSVEELTTVCGEMRNNINQIIENVRRLARDLSPVVLDDLGLQAAIEYLVNNFAKIYNIEIKYKTTDINHLFNEESQRIIYRILQEALTNIGKHSKAQNVSLTIEEKESDVEFTVVDDGRGFNVQKTMNKKGADRGMGLEAMTERVRILGGTISIVSLPGIKTTISFTAPIR